MTREEAVTVLKAFMENPLFSDVHKAAFNIAIHDIKQRHDWDINNLILINKDNYEPLDQEPTTKNDLALIHTEGLDEEIRCTMCTNYMKSDRGCDGSCVVNKDMYKAVVDAIEKRIQPTTKNNLGVDCIDRNYATRLLADIYHNSISDSSLKIYQIINWLNQLPSVIPQYSSELEKNSQKLEKDFGELDCISRQAVLELIADYDLSMGQVVRGIHALPSVTPQEPKIGHCRDCKWWKDSDGAFRRGIGAESKCPMNRIEVYEGNGYCFLFEPQESEDKE